MNVLLANTDAQRLSAFDVLLELRPSLVRETFLADLQRMGLSVALLQAPDVRAVACFRELEMFSTGRILYVDDLVTTAAHRSKGYGRALLRFLHDAARARGCRYLELDSGSTRTDAHRFYQREGLEPVALHFSIPCDSGARWSPQS